MFAGLSGDDDSFFCQLLAQMRLGPVGAVADEVSAEGAMKKFVERIDVVAVAGDVYDVEDASVWRADEMLSNTVIEAAQRAAIAVLCKAGEALFESGARYTADFDGMGIDEGKRGASPASSANARHSRSRMGVSSALRSANF